MTEDKGNEPDKKDITIEEKYELLQKKVSKQSIILEAALELTIRSWNNNDIYSAVTMLREAINTKSEISLLVPLEDPETYSEIKKEAYDKFGYVYEDGT